MDHARSAVDDKFSIRAELDLSAARWRKLSRYSGGTVEFAFVSHADATTYVVLRDTGGTMLVFTPSEWDAFLSGARAGEFDRAH